MYTRSDESDELIRLRGGWMGGEGLSGGRGQGKFRSTGCIVMRR